MNREMCMGWLKRLFGGKDDAPERDEPPAARTPDEVALDFMLQSAFLVRTEFFSGLGEVHPDVIAPFINPMFMGGPRWPAMRQSWRMVRRPASTLFASDGLSDPFDDDLTPMGYRVEVCVETGERFADGDRGMDEAKGSWAFDLVYQASQAVAGAGGIYEAVEEGMIVTTVLHIPEAPERLRDADDRVGVIIGFPTPDLPPAMEFPNGKVLLLPVTPLLPSELAYIENEEDGQAARRHLISLLLRQPRPHFATGDRDPVV
jgi:hypothetical protein